MEQLRASMQRSGNLGAVLLVGWAVFRRHHHPQQPQNPYVLQIALQHIIHVSAAFDSMNAQHVIWN
jgi:hypothetical protein